MSTHEASKNMMLNDDAMIENDVMSVNHISNKSINNEKEEIENGIKELVPINEIDKIKTGNEGDTIRVIVELPYYVLKSFKENVMKKYGVDMNLTEELSFTISNYNNNFGIPQHSTSSLLFVGREPRKDVLLKLKRVASELYSDDNFPLLYRMNIEKALKRALGNIDSRTFAKYFRCVKEFVERNTGQRLVYYSPYNVKGFKETVDEKLAIADSRGAHR